ncbi:hypothetical protein B0H11DRAFT_1866143 [Mycena galericulata]|nr:hypothetical protein B0H11DRAFT_1866143 [Mycena galericulata]
MASTLTILDIPPEITSVIFAYCVQFRERYGPEDSLPGLWPHEPPSLLARVCRQWRNVALSTPELWVAIQIDCPYFIEDVVPALDRWLVRACSLPLSIDIRYQVHPDTSSDSILHLMHRHSEQLQNLTLTIPSEDLYRFPEIVGPLPALRKLVITCRRLPFDGQKLSAFKLAPELRDVYFLTGFSPRNVTLPWGQLTTFRADTLRVSNCHYVLSVASALINCRFDVWEDDTPLTSLPPLLHLESLILRGMGPSTDLLAHLTTPSLIHLEVQSVELDAWCAFLARSECALKHLSIETTGWTSAMFTQGLENLRSLIELELFRPGQSAYRLFRLLHDHPHLLVNLKVFEESPSFRNTPSLKHGRELCRLVIEMLESRRNSEENPRLERFSLCTTDGLVGSPDLFRRLQALVEGGMRVYVSDSEAWAA